MWPIVLDERGDQGEMWFLSSIVEFPLLMKPSSTRRGNLPLKTMEHCEEGDQDEMWFPHWMAQYPLLSPLIRADCCGLWRRIGRSFFAATFTFTFISPLTFTFSITIFIYVRVQEVCTYVQLYKLTKVFGSLYGYTQHSWNFSKGSQNFWKLIRSSEEVCT